MEYQSLQPISTSCQTRPHYSINDGGYSMHYDQQVASRLHEVFLIAMLTVSILTLISLFESTPETQNGWGFFLKAVFGDVAYLMPILIAYIGGIFYGHWKKPFQSSHMVAIKLVGASLLYFSIEGICRGGELGQALSESFFRSHYAMESWVVVMATMIASVFMITNLSCLEIGSFVCQFASGFSRKSAGRYYTADSQVRSESAAFNEGRESNLISYEKSFSQPHIHDPQSNQLINCLQHFGMRAIVSNKIPGPVVTRFELHLAPGLKSSAICSHHKEIARYLCVPEVRVIEVIAGKSCVGIEVPNSHRETFSFSDLSYALDQCSCEKLPLLLGKGTDNTIKVVDLDSMHRVGGVN